MRVAERHLAREAFRRFAYVPPKKTARVGARSHRFLEKLFGQQTAFIRDPARRKAGFCTRRAGKTTLVGSYLLSVALEHDEVLCTFYAITRIRAKELIWDELHRLDREYALGCKFNETELSVRTPNGSLVRLTGADKMKEAEKKRGDKNKVVILDEAQLFPEEVLRKLIDDIIEPTLLDLRGTVCLMGTPGIVEAGLWWEITRNETELRAPGWSVHSWSILDNPFLPHAREELADLQRTRRWADDHPTLVREYKGRWVNDAGALVYTYDSVRNTYEQLPRLTWQYVMGIDLGHDDAFAIVVWAFSEDSRTLFEVDCFKESGLIPSQWAAEIKKRRDRFDPVSMVVDTGGLGKAIVEEMKQRHGLALKAAEKTEKASFQRLMNDDLAGGFIKVRASSPIALEWSRLAKDPKDPEKEDPRFPNHSADGGLYGWREAKHWLGEDPDAEPEPGTPEAADAEAEEIERSYEERLRGEQDDERELFSDDNEEDWL